MGSLDNNLLTRAQAEAIAAQTRVYYLPETSCAGLARDPRILTDPEEISLYAGTLVDGAVAVAFRYEYEDRDGAGLEVTVYNRAGEVTTSQDWG